MERYPLSWPADKPRTQANQRQRAAFNKKVDKGNYSESRPLTVAEAVTRIEIELDAYTRIGHHHRVPPNSIIISTNLATGVKGRPLSSLANPADPGAAVYFNLDGRDYCLPCDKWERVADNLAAIAAHIGAMRGIERWGVGSSKDVYTGFKALPEKAGGSNGAWWQILQVDQDATQDEIKSAYKRLTAHYHPDKSTANRDMFDLVQKAYSAAMIQFNK